MVELKAIIQLENVHIEQAKNYLEAYNMDWIIDKFWKYKSSIQKTHQSKA